MAAEKKRRIQAFSAHAILSGNYLFLDGLNRETAPTVKQDSQKNGHGYILVFLEQV